MDKIWPLGDSSNISNNVTGECPGFLKGGVPISLGSLKKVIRF